jgi:hypothetical protein
MNYRSLNYALKSRGRLGVDGVVGHQTIELGLNVGDETAAQLVEIDVAGLHDISCVFIIDQSQQQVFKRRIFVVPLVSKSKGTVRRLLKGSTEVGIFSDSRVLA